MSLSSTQPLFLYLHGFASGPSSTKAQFFRTRLEQVGVDLQIWDLNEGEGGFRGMTVSRSLRRIEELLVSQEAQERGVVLIGSSLGGYLACLAASRNPNVRAVVLMAPAFDLPARWQHILGQEVIANWRKDGQLEVDHYAYQRKEPIAFGFYLDSLGHPPYPNVTCPGLDLHGVHDLEVPVGTSRKFVALSPSVRLVEFDSDHGLTDVLDELWEEAAEFLAPWLPPR